MTSYAPVTAFVRGLEILRALNRLGGKAGVGRVHAATGIPKPTIVRLFETLIHAGYVTRDAVDRTYVLTAKTMSLSEGFRAFDDLLAHSRPLHDALREKLVWPSDLAVLDRNEMTIIDTSRHGESLWFNRSVGSRIPILATAIGRAHLAFMPADEQDRILDVLAQSSGRFDRLARDRDAVRAMLDETRARGFATADRDFMNQTRAIAFPIRAAGRVIASANVIVIAEAMSLNDVIERYAPALKQLTQDIEGALAGPDGAAPVWPLQAAGVPRLGH
ncbi:MAG: IclR family transcriptional regulator C-terminal domain-containing protein [Rhodospirillaceae bacterium]